MVPAAARFHVHSLRNRSPGPNTRQPSAANRAHIERHDTRRQGRTSTPPPPVAETHIGGEPTDRFPAAPIRRSGQSASVLRRQPAPPSPSRLASAGNAALTVRSAHHQRLNDMEIIAQAIAGGQALDPRMPRLCNLTNAERVRDHRVPWFESDGARGRGPA